MVLIILTSFIAIVVFTNRELQFGIIPSNLKFFRGKSITREFSDDFPKSLSILYYDSSIVKIHSVSTYGQSIMIVWQKP